MPKPTIVLSQRQMASLTVFLPNLNAFRGEITQAYSQSTTKYGRNIFLRATREMEIPPNTALLVLKTLYWIPESGPHSKLTNLQYNIRTLSMKRRILYPCLIYWSGGVLWLEPS